MIDAIFNRMLKTMPECPALEPFVPVPVLLEFLGVDADNPRVARVLEWVAPQHYRAETRSLSGLATVWVCMRLDPSRAVELYIMLRCYTPDPGRFQMPREFTKEEARP